MKSYGLLLEAFAFMKNAGYVCDVKTLGAVVETTVRLGRHDLMFRILDEMKEQVDASTDVFPRVVRAALWKEQHALVLKVFEHMHQAGVDAMAANTTAVRTAFKFKQYYFVLQVLEKMVKCGVDASGEYSHVLMFFRKVRRYDYLLYTFQAMRDLGYYQEEVLCSVALTAAVQLGKQNVVFEICNGADGNDLNSKRMYSHALDEARAAKKQDLVNRIMRKMNTTIGNTPVESKVTPSAAKHETKVTHNQLMCVKLLCLRLMTTKRR